MALSASPKKSGDDRCSDQNDHKEIFVLLQKDLKCGLFLPFYQFRFGPKLLLMCFYFRSCQRLLFSINILFDFFCRKTDNSFSHSFLHFFFMQ